MSNTARTVLGSFLAATLFLAPLATGCRVGGPSGSPDATGTPASCVACHGEPGNAAPPRGVDGETETAERAVGAHRSHLGASDWHAPVVCDACHVVPARTDDEGHIGMRPAELTWSAPADDDGASPSWDGTRCTNTYCHGGTLDGGSNTAPAWTTVDGTQAACGTCHGLPPGGDHPARHDCASCHGEVVGTGGVWVDAAKHIDGEVQVDGLQCDSCHGADGNPAPPLSVGGESGTSVRGVGAHRSHLATGAAWHGDIACTECHRVPATIDATGHADSDLPAELEWGSLATGDGEVSPSFDGTACSNTYCHGGTLDGGSNTTPEWTTVGGGEAACGTCHGLPPDEDHPVGTDCSGCHGEVIAADGSWVDRTKHVDGEVQVGGMQCDSCHGAAGDPAPPPDFEGNTEPTARGVGAHRSHLPGSGEAVWHALVECDDCHAVPATVDAAGHIDESRPADLTWSDLATGDGEVDPSFDGTNCSNVYCHGGTLDGGSNATPAWTTVDGTQAACGTCHGLPPGDGHTAITLCASCHRDVVAAGGGWTDPSLHINGEVDVAGTACDSCHGADGNPAPPTDVAGSTSTRSRGVGAHESHLATGSGWHADIPCAECHTVPATVEAADHLDTLPPAELVWGTLATDDGSLEPSFDGTRCSNTYCHGATLPGGSLKDPVWTTVNGTQAACGTCHSMPPAGSHDPDPLCYTCHSSVLNSDWVFIAPELHVNGVPNL